MSARERMKRVETFEIQFKKERQKEMQSKRVTTRDEGKEKGGKKRKER